MKELIVEYGDGRRFRLPVTAGTVIRLNNAGDPELVDPAELVEAAAAPLIAAAPGRMYKYSQTHEWLDSDAGEQPINIHAALVQAGLITVNEAVAVFGGSLKMEEGNNVPFTLRFGGAISEVFVDIGTALLASATYFPGGESGLDMGGALLPYFVTNNDTVTVSAGGPPGITSRYEITIELYFMLPSQAISVNAN